MVTERVNIDVRETGTRVVVRRLQDIGTKATNAGNQLFRMQRALFVLGGAGIISGLTRQLDALTNYENRLKLTTTSVANLNSVQSELFDVAARSRTSFDSISELYSRTALNVRQLGISQEETLRFTESLSKATIIGGASAREANAAIIQLSQGLASNRLSGDELRSVLEQLPFVADVIAKQLGVTRGELRQFGTEGKISAETVLAAFREQAGEIDRLFDQLDPTISQALEVAKTRYLQFLDTFDDNTGFSAAIADGILLIADHVGTLIGTLTVLAAAIISTYSGRGINAVLGFIATSRKATVATQSLRSASVALATQRVVAISTAKAEATQEAISAAARIKQLATERALLLQKQAAALENAKAILTDRTLYASNQQRIAATTALNRSYVALTANTQAATAATGRLATAQATANSTTNALVGANARLGAAQAAQNSRLAQLSSKYPLLGAAISGVGRALGFLRAAFISNPLGAGIFAVTTLTLGFLNFGNQLKVTADGVVGFKDFTIAAFQILGEYVNGVLSSIGGYFRSAIDGWLIIWNTLMVGLVELGGVWLIGMKTVINSVIALFVGTVNGTIAAWNILPAALLDIMNIARNNILTAVENIVNGFVDAVQSIPEKFGSAMTAIVEYGKSAVTFISDAFAALPAVIGNIAEKAGAKLKEGFNKAINVVIRGLNSIGASISEVTEDFGSDGINIGIDLPDAPSLDSFIKDGELSLDRFRGTVTGAAREAGSIYAEEFANAYAQDYAGSAANTVLESIDSLSQPIIERARENLAAAEEAANAQTNNPSAAQSPGAASGGGSGSGSSSNDPTFAQKIAEINGEIAALGLLRRERELLNGVQEIEKEIKRSLTASETELAVEALKNLEIAKEKAAVLEELRGPEEAANLRIEALNALLREGTITNNEYAESMRTIAASADTMANSLLGGLTNGIARVAEQANSLGQGVSDVVVSAFDQASSAVTDFSKSGRQKMRDLFSDISNQLLKLATNQLFAAILNSFIPGAGSIIGGGGGVLPGLATGGSIMPSGAGNTDSQIVAFKKRPDERVDVLTPSQQKSQEEAGAGAGNEGTVVAPNIQVAVVLSRQDVVSAFENEDGDRIIINAIANNSSTVKKTLG